jgi:hypothetical protein
MKYLPETLTIAPHPILSLLIFLGSTEVSSGTAMELAWAYMRHIPRVVVVEPDNIHLSYPLIRGCIKVTADNLEEGIHKTLSILDR